MKRKGLAAIVLSICIVAIAAFAVWDVMNENVSSDSAASSTKWVTGSTPESEALAEEQAQQSDDIVTALMEQQEKNKDIAKNTDQKDSGDKNYNIVEETKEDQKDPEKPFDQEHPELMDQVEYSAETLMVKFKKPFNGKVNDDLKKAGVAKLDVLFEMEDHIWYTAYLKKTADVDKALENVRKIKKVAVAEYNFKYETSAAETFDAAVEANPNAGEQWHHKHCDIKEAWKKAEDDKGVGGGSSNVVVAVIDTGVDYTHEDLKANMWYNSKEVPDNNIDDDGNGYVDDYYGVDMTAKKGSGNDDNGHGTHVAGIIAASNNKTGVVGIAYNSKIMAIKAGDASGYFQQSNVAEAILYAYDHGADVINMSFGGSASSIAVQDALATAYSRCVLVASAGNEGSPNEGTDYYRPLPSYPSAFSYVLGVMSVDQNNVESSFTNWDANLYNSYEYEVYAPGNQILSTIPGDRYAKMSGTSMASPVVSAQAAILRSYYEDSNTYPTKFIYGQIVGTAADDVQCVNPERHTINGGLHNIPGVVNFYKSIDELPTPDIGMSGYTLFDTDEFTADTEGITEGKVSKNNGDGIVDAGETIALGLTLKNRWGMSEDTIVSIDATNDNGVTNPYVTFLNNDIDYGSVGTYSESDSGKLYSDDGEMWNGWENPFYIKIADNCPNDYSVSLNVTITYKNGLDSNDTTIYKDEAQILLKVRRGVILPNKIKEDMTLTKDNYYIIPNSTTVMEGATLRIEEGTQVQFWCSDPEDSYADTAIAYLKVNGKLICEGTEEEPIEIFPSEWMDKYNVKIYTAGDGYASMEYTNVVNPYLTIDKAENCEFTQNYKEGIAFRFLDSGNVYSSIDSGISKIGIATGCSFYKLGGNDSFEQYFLEGNEYSGCMFVDSSINYPSKSIMTNCVFYGNNNYWDNKSQGYISSIQLENHESDIMKIDSVFSNKELEKTYVILAYGEPFYQSWKEYDTLKINAIDRFVANFGGELISFDDINEFNYVEAKLKYDVTENGIYYPIGYICGSRLDKENGGIYNYNGTKLPNDIPSDYSEYIHNTTCELGYLIDGSLIFNDGYDDSTYTQINPKAYNRYIIEISNNTFVTDIQLEDYIIDLDTETQYQIKATITPETADVTKLVYESQDETIAVVDENGLITPVGHGSTDILVYAPDRAIYNYITVNVLADESDFYSDMIAQENINHSIVIDEEKLAARNKWTETIVTEEWEKFVAGGHNTRFYSNVILNRLNDDDTSTWLRITAPNSDEYQNIGLGGNYWGTTNKELVNKQILDFDDYGTLADINEGEILTEAPSNTYPFVVDSYLEMNGEKVDTVGNDLVTFVVDFNRAMDTSIDLSVQFGSAYPYADYTVEGEWATDKQWRGTMQLTTIIENGYQYWSVSNGKAAGTSLKLYKDWGRFPFMIDTSTAQSLMMEGEATETGINLTWMQDDFETLAGYNVYRSTSEDGLYTKLNRTVIPADTKEWFDDTVIPGQKYYYNFTVVQTDLTESEPSGKVTITALDTMAPDIYHSPVYHTFTGSNLVISATVMDNVGIKNAKLYYRTAGTDEWKSKTMTNNNDKYSAVINASEITTDGLEYYIEADDGISKTYKGSAEEPYAVTVQVAVAAGEKGDVDGNGSVEVADAMMLLLALNDRYNMTEVEFARADLDDNGELAAKEALRIIQYVSGTIGSIL